MSRGREQQQRANILRQILLKKRERILEELAIVIMDNFKGQVTERMTELMESHNIYCIHV